MGNNIKILYDFQTMSQQKYGGVSRYFYEIISRLEKKEQLEISMPLLCGFNYYFKEYYKLKKIGKYVTNNSGIYYLLNKIYFKINTNNKKYDIIHPTYYDPFIINKSKRSKMVITIHDMIPELMPDKLWFAEELIKNKRAYIEKADMIIAVSECTKRDILKIYPDVDADKIKVIYHGSSMEITDKALSVELPNEYILFVGNRDIYKNFVFFINSLKEIFEEKKNLMLVCAGGPSFTQEEMEQLKALNMQNRVIWMQMDDVDLQWAYRKARCFVFPSLYEGFGIPILEAWTCKCPILLCKASCFPEIAQDAALYFEPGNKEQLRKQLNLLLVDENIRNELIVRGTERLSNFSWDVASEKTFEVYMKVLGIED